MLTINVESALTSVLLVAAIVAVIFVIVLLAKVITAMDKVNKMMDDTTLAVYDIKKQVTGAIESARSKGSKVTGMASNGISVAKSIKDKLPIIGK